MAQTDVRPRCADEEADTKRRLVAAATDEFFACGYSGASLRQICSRAGVTTGALYFFFENKQDLLRSVIDPLAKGALELLGEGGPYGPESPYATGAVSRDYERASGVLHKITGEFFRQRRLVSIVLSNRDNVVVAGFLADVCQLIKKNTRAHVQACTGSADPWTTSSSTGSRPPSPTPSWRSLPMTRTPSWQTATSPRFWASSAWARTPSCPSASRRGSERTHQAPRQGRPARSADFSPGGPR